MNKFTWFLVFLQLLMFGICDAANCPTIKTRSQWGAAAAKSQNSVGGNLPYVLIHHTETPQCPNVAACEARVKSIQNYHMNTQKWGDIGYNFLVDQFGNIYSGRGWGKQGAHSPNYNRNSIGISIIGSYGTTSPSESALKATKDLIACGVSTGKISSSYKLLGHRQTRATTCPGDKLYSIIKQWPHWASQP